MRHARLVWVYPKDHKWIKRQTNGKEKTFADIISELIDFKKVCENPTPNEIRRVKKKS